MFTVEQNPHNNTSINHLNGYHYYLEDMLQILNNITFLDPEASEGLAEELEEDYPETFQLTKTIEKEMGYTFTDIQVNILCAQIAIEKVGERILEESAKQNGIVYMIGSEKAKILKIGFTKNLEERFKQLQAGRAYELKVIKTKPGTFKTEQQALKRAKRFHIHGEWFTWDDSIVENF